jgi:hypothetical protein
MSITTDVRSYADTALSQGKAALNSAGNAAVLVNKRLVADAPKPAYAALGAADLVATAVTRRVESLPTDAVSNVGRVQQTGRGLIVRTQNDALARLTELRGSIGALPTVARTTTEAYLSTAKDLYGKLTARGEAKAAELRKDPRVGRLLGQANEVAESVQGAVAPVVKSAFDSVESTPVRKTARKAPTRKPAAAKAPARKATATKAPARKATATKAPARKATARKAPASK